MSDAAGRRWDCVIRDTGGTPMRYDPLSGAVYMRDRAGNEPFFAVGEERPALDPNCFRFERVTDPKNGDMLGWLYYRTCRERPRRDGCHGRGRRAAGGAGDAVELVEAAIERIERVEPPGQPC